MKVREKLLTRFLAWRDRRRLEKKNAACWDCFLRVTLTLGEDNGDAQPHIEAAKDALELAALVFYKQAKRGSRQSADLPGTHAARG